ncbi:MAG TPA: permease prefix domain 1-containing protein, partial [Gemmatimonadales bacterium]|nr:permease prefix domain 1-containing protein [Gemmatimonadales bacterium]
MLPELLSDFRYRFRALFQRADMERDLDDELRFHLEHEAAKYRREGVPAHEAMRRARIAFGGVDVAKEASREGRGLALLEAASQDLRYAVRALRRNPGFTLGVILTLALGIGANAAMFGIVDRLLFRTPAYLVDAGRVHRVYFRWQVRGRERTMQSTEFTRYLDLRRWT